MKKRYVRYRLVSESSVIERGRAQLVGIREDNERVWNNPDMKNKTAYQLLKEAVKIIAGAGADTTWLAYTVMKRMGGTIIALIKDFIKKLPSIAARIFNFVKSLVGIFWNTFGTVFINLLKGLASICATFLGTISDALDKISGNSSGNQGKTGTSTGTPSNGTQDSTGTSSGNSSGEKGKTSLLSTILNPNPYELLHKNLDNANATPEGKPQSNSYTPNFILSDRAIRILNEAANNPGTVSRTLDNWIEKAKPRCRNLCYRCIKGNVAKTNPQLASMIGASTILICGYSRSSGQFTNLQNNTNTKN